MSATLERRRTTLSELAQELEVPHIALTFLAGQAPQLTPEKKSIIRPWVPTETWLEVFHRGKLGEDFHTICLSTDLHQIKEIFHRHPRGSIEKWYALKRLIALLA